MAIASDPATEGCTSYWPRGFELITFGTLGNEMNNEVMGYTMGSVPTSSASSLLMDSWLWHLYRRGRVAAAMRCKQTTSYIALISNQSKMPAEPNLIDFS